MAVIKKGKLRGRQGSFVHRVYRGQEIVQSYPRTLEPRGQTVIENQLFGECSRMNAGIYRLIKDFALEHLDFALSWKTMAILKRLFFKRRGREVSNLKTWKKIEDFTNLPINENILIGDILDELPEVDVHKDKLFFLVPENKMLNKVVPLKIAVFIEYTVSVIRYDFQLRLAEVIYTMNSGRQEISNGFEEKMLEMELVDDFLKGEALVILCFGLRFFSSSQSYGYLNSKKVNPTEILGAWYKG